VNGSNPTSNEHKIYPKVQVTIEIPKGSFIKRGSDGKLDFISPVPCPFNYGSISGLIGRDGDLLDAIVLGRQIPMGTQLWVEALGAVEMIDRGLYDDKLICSHSPISAWQQRWILVFFKVYAKAKFLINFARGHMGRNSCEGWCDAELALTRAIATTDNDEK